MCLSATMASRSILVAAFSRGNEVPVEEIGPSCPFGPEVNVRQITGKEPALSNKKQKYEHIKFFYQYRNVMYMSFSQGPPSRKKEMRITAKLFIE